MKTEKTFFGRMAFAVVALCSLVAAGADKVVNASSFGWNGTWKTPPPRCRRRSILEPGRS